VKQREWFEVAQAIKTLGGAVTIDTDFIIFLWHPKAANLYRLQKPSPSASSGACSSSSA